MSSQLVYLAWDGHHRTLVGVFEKLLVTSHFVDCTIGAEGQKLKAHKEVLSAFSPFLELLFRQETENNPTVIISGMSFRDLRSLVDFMYQGKLEVTGDRIQDLMDAAECLQIKGLGGGHKENDSEKLNNTIMLPESVDDVECAVDPQDLLYNSEFHSKTQDDTLLSIDGDLLSENDGFSENMPESIGDRSASDMRMEVICSEKKNDSSGAAHRDIPQELDAAFLKTQRIGRNEPVLRLMPGLPADVNPGDSLTHPSHTTPACDRDPSGPIGRGGSNGSISTDQYRCQICGKTFARNVSLKAHMRIHAEDRSLRNDECNDAAVTSIKLNKHQRILKGQKLYKCSECEFKSANRRVFCVHLRVHSGVKPYKCTECEYASANSWTLKIHQRIHSGLKPYKCTECEYTSTQNCHLKIHQRIHSGLKPYKCTECEYTCALNGNLKKHQLIHSGLKPYKCSECDYAATSSSDLKIHQRRHSGVRPYKCSECDYTATSSSDVKRHQLIHRGVKAYKCSECSYASVWKQNLKLHQRTHRLKP